MLRRSRGFPAVLLAWVGSSCAPAPLAYTVIREDNVEASMRDGVMLRADVYRPDAPGSFPALLQRTPYSKKGSSEAQHRFERLSATGYVVVVQDTRGRYASDGVAIPHDEAEDGYDTVEWVASLPYVNGRVGMFGGSYLATTQLTAAMLAPPSLAAIQPSASYASRYDMVYQGGAFYLSDGLAWNLSQAADVRRRTAGASFEERDGPLSMTGSERQSFDAWLRHLPLNAVPAPDLARFAPGYFWMLEHPTYDSFWETYDIAARHEDFEVPALHVTGWYDTLLPGTLANFAGLRARAATERARSGQRLIVGPWTHARPTASSTRIGDVDFGGDAGFDLDAVRAAWFDFWLRGDAVGPAPGPPVRIFVMGENAWRDEQEWPLSRAVPTALYLRSQGGASGRQGDGALSFERPEDEPPDRYSYNPSDPVPTGAMGGYSRAPSDPAEIGERDDVLVYTSEPLDRDIEVTGHVTLVLWAASTARDTDFTGKLVDVRPDGVGRTLTDGILRARSRTGKDSSELLTPNESVRLEIDLLATSNVFKAGHRIRVEVSSSNFPRFDRNPNTGAEFGTSAEVRVARQTVYHDRERASHVVLPVVPR